MNQFYLTSNDSHAQNKPSQKMKYSEVKVQLRKEITTSCSRFSHEVNQDFMSIQTKISPYVKNKIPVFALEASLIWQKALCIS